jgi:PAS domain S-box-containing protein
LNLVAITGCDASSLQNWRIRLVSLLVLVIGLGVTAIAFRAQLKHAASKAQTNLSAHTDTIAGAIMERVQDHKQILRSGAAMMMSSDRVTREDWNNFYKRQLLKVSLPGIQGFGYSVMIPPDKLEQHTAAIRAEGYLNYRVWPEGERPLYSAIIYLEPFSNRNLRAFGYDMFSEEVRRVAMQAACDDDAAILTGPVSLVQEDGIDEQIGTLMYVPVYRGNAQIDTVSERRAALVGWVYSPYRMNDLIKGIFTTSRIKVSSHLKVQIFDSNPGKPVSLLFDNGVGLSPPAAAEEVLISDVEISTAGRSWLVRCQAHRSSLGENIYTIAWITLGAGTLLSFASACLLFSSMSTQYRAQREAQRLTVDLRHSEGRWKFAIESSNVGVWDWDIQNGLVVYSTRWKEILGYEDHEIGQSYNEWLSRVVSEDLGPTLEIISDCLQGKKASFSGEFRMLAKDGSLKWIRAAGVITQWDSAKNPLRMIGTHTDITSDKNREIQQSDLLKRQQQIAEMKTRFISVTSHEFRTPMAAALTAADILNNHADHLTSAKRHELLGRINISMRRMAELLDDVLSLNRIEEGRTQPIFAPVDIRPVVDRTIEEVQVGDRNVHAINLSAPASLLLTTDPKLLEHVLSNLLSNAIRYSPSGTPITLRIEAVSEQMRLVVEDKGIGIPAGDMKRILEPFERGTNVAEIKGTGLGLSIVKQTIDLLHGALEIESVEGQGSRFTVILPICPANSAKIHE